VGREEYSRGPSDGRKGSLRSCFKDATGKKNGRTGHRPTNHPMDQQFITDRKASLVINGHESAMTPTQTGIPQGSPVSPIIFAIYNSGVFDEVEEAVLGATGHCHYRFCAWLRRIRVCLQFSCVKYQRDGVQKFCEKYKRVVLSGFSLFEVEDCAPPKRKIAGKQQERSASKKGKGKA
jgi:hypothetical protein